MAQDKKHSEKMREKLTRSLSRKTKNLFYKDGSSHRAIQNSHFSPTFANSGSKKATPFALDGENLVPEGNDFEEYAHGNSFLFEDFRSNSPEDSII